MTEDETYRLATGTSRVTEKLDEKLDELLGSSGVMTDEEVIERLAQYADPAALANFQLLQMRYEVTGGQLAPGRVLYAPVQCPGGVFMAAAFTLEPDEEDEGSWVTVWHQVIGPVTLEELKELARA